jgi:hypothetical protein
VIVDLIVQVLFGILNAVLGLIPAFEIWQQAEGEGNHYAAERVGDMLAVWDLFSPVGLLLGALVAVLAARVFAAGVSFVDWLWARLPFKSS